MLGETELVQREPLWLDTPYQVSGRITAIERRVGRRLGTFDMMPAHLKLSLAEARDEPVATCTNSFVIPPEELA